MKLQYYDNLTPPDYEPPHFRTGSYEEAQMTFAQRPNRLKFGTVESGHHR
jgi:meiosis-specific protein HOP1